MKLMIVESPNKIEKISGIVGDGWKLAACAGHIRDLPAREQGVEAPEFVPKYEVSESKKSLIAKLKTLSAQADEVFLATDSDREGEAISWHLKEVLGLKKYTRVVFDAINDVVVKKGLAAPRLIDDNGVRSQEARRVLDRLVGWLVSPALCRAAGAQGLTAGRVQSPAVRLVVERERDIQKFKVTNHFGAEVSFGKWVAKWNVAPFLTGDEKYLMDDALAIRAAALREFNITSSESNDAKAAPPAPFRSATLMQAASVALGFSPSKTMDLAQNLFAAGHINYHRTDKPNFDDESIVEIRAFALGEGMPVAAKIRKWKSADAAQEGHEAIRPIYLEKKELGDSQDERALYKLIWERAVASQLEDAEYKVNDLALSAMDDDGQEFQFKARGRVLISEGWKSLTPKDAAEEEATDDALSTDGAVPMFKVGASALAESGRVLEKKTQAPGRYSEASLIAKLDAMGIGRPGTLAAISKNIMEREYVFEEKRKLKPTQKGMQVVIALVKAKCGFIEYSYTVELEKELDRIAKGETSYLAVVTASYQQIRDDCEKLKASEVVVHPCPKCGKSLMRMQNSDKTKYFWGCVMYKEIGCTGSMLDIAGKPGVKPAPILSKHLCPDSDCKKPLIRRTKKDEYDFWACSGYPKCKRSFKNKDGKPDFSKK